MTADSLFFDSDGNPEWSAQPLRDEPDCFECADASCPQCHRDADLIAARMRARFNAKEIR